MDKEDFIYENIDRNYKSKIGIEFILKIYVVLGIFLCLSGAAYFIMVTFNIELTEKQMLALFVSGSGFMLSLMSWAILLLKRERLKYEKKQSEKMDLTSQFIKTWVNFERVSREILGLDKSNESFSIRNIFNRLFKEDKINKDEFFQLEEALHSRNNIVHGGVSVPLDKMQNLIEIVAKITFKISR